jgi:hypothetical protein
MNAKQRIAVNVVLAFLILFFLLIICLKATNPAPLQHPRHEISVFRKKKYGRNFLVIVIPRCEHVEAVFADLPEKETIKEARERLHGFAAMSASFYNPKNNNHVDFVKRFGKVNYPRTTKRYFLIKNYDGSFEITNDLEKVKQAQFALALGQMLVDFQLDGFSLHFVNMITPRMALGLNPKNIFIVQSTSDLWRLSKFMKEDLGCDQAINTDGGHVIKGTSRSHIVFIWKNLTHGGH